MTASAAAKRQGVTLPAATKRALDDVSRFGQARLDAQRAQFARLDEALPLPRVHLPRLPVARLLPHHLGRLAEALAVAPILPSTPDSTPVAVR